MNPSLRSCPFSEVVPLWKADVARVPRPGVRGGESAAHTSGGFCAASARDSRRYRAKAPGRQRSGQDGVLTIGGAAGAASPGALRGIFGRLLPGSAAPRGPRASPWLPGTGRAGARTLRAPRELRTAPPRGPRPGPPGAGAGRSGGTAPCRGAGGAQRRRARRPGAGGSRRDVVRRPGGEQRGAAERRRRPAGRVGAGKGRAGQSGAAGGALPRLGAGGRGWLGAPARTLTPSELLLSSRATKKMIRK